MNTQRIDLLTAFETLIGTTGDSQLENLDSALSCYEQAAPADYRALQGHYLMRDIIQAIRDESKYRQQRRPLIMLDGEYETVLA